MLSNRDTFSCMFRKRLTIVAITMEGLETTTKGFKMRTQCDDSVSAGREVYSESDSGSTWVSSHRW